MRNRPLISVVLGAATLAAVAAAGCSLVTDWSECAIDADCTARLGPRGVCTDEICSLPSALTGGPCQRTVGEIDAPQALVIGILLPLTGPEGGFGVPLLKAVELAWANFDEIGGIDGRPIGLLICDTEGDNEVALAAGQHAVEVGRVSAIIGPDFSSQTIDIATKYAIPNDVLLVTPSGTAAAITSLADEDLVWRTAPSDSAQAAAIARLVQHEITVTRGLALDAPTVWILTRADDEYSVGLGDGLTAGFAPELAESAHLHRSAYPENWTDAWFAESALNLPAPDLVLLMGAAESWDIAEAIDDAFDSAPTFFFPDAARNVEEASVASPALQGRILGTAPQAVGDVNYTPYTTFRVKYQAEYEDDPNAFQFVANAYDALHLVALAAAGGGGVTGPELAEGMAKLSFGEPVSANSEGAQRGIDILSSGGTVDFEGASGRLDFDYNGDPSPSAISLWCFAEGAVPEVGHLLSADGTFTPIDCGGAMPGVPQPDMGAPDMGGGD